MLRDVTDLRHRDRMLVSKDATIREVHHRVKNNLQTIAALLRLQARRLQSDEARAALEESERRIRSIAVVHETLSRDASDVVRVRRHRAAARPSGRGDRGGPRVAHPVRGRRRRGRAPRRARHAAGGRAQRADAERGGSRLPAGPPRACVEGTVRVALARDGDEVVVDVIDDGVGLPDGLRPRDRRRARALDRADARHHRDGRRDRAP